ncbi:MAG: RNAase P [Thermoplasmata archaeon]
MGERRHRVGRRSREIVRIAQERMVILFKMARERALAGDLALAERYVALARNIGMRYNVRPPAPLKRLYCRTCGSFLIPGRTLRVRIRPGRAISSCLKCGRVVRRPTTPATGKHLLKQRP